MPVIGIGSAAVDPVASLVSALNSESAALTAASTALTLAAAAVDLTNLGQGALIGASNGAGDAANINTRITAAAAGGGGRVIGLPGASYVLETSIVMKSGVTLEMTGCTISPVTSSIGPLVTNSGAAAARTVMDVTTTASSTTVTSAAAAFTSGDVGKAALVYGAGVQGGPLVTTIASVTNATNAVLATAASTSLTNASASFGTRDSDITVTGGEWVTNVTLGTNVHVMRLRRADNITVQDAKFSATSGLYQVHFADCTNYTAENLTFDLRTGSSDGVHVTGPTDSGVIRNIKGRAISGLVSVTPNDYAAINDTYGPISNLDIESIHPVGQSNGVAVAVQGGSPATYCRDVRVRDVSGSVSGQSLVGIGDDTLSANNTGGSLDGVVVENVTGQITGTGQLISVTASNGKGIRIRGLRADSTALTCIGLVWLPTTASVESLHVSDVRVGTLASRPAIVRTDGYVKNVIVQGVQGDQVGHVLYVHGTSGRVDRAIVRDAHAIYLQSPCFVDSTSGTLGSIEISNIQGSTGQFGLGSYACATAEVHAVNVNVNPNDGASSIDVANASGVITVHATNCNFNSKNITGTSGGKIRSRSLGFPVNITSAFLQNNAGDAAYSRISTDSPGVGPVVADGTSWIPVKPKRTGTATLVSGTATVTDTAIATTSRVRVYVQTPGGTVGAPYVSTITAATSFVITSTSGSDTSVVRYEVLLD